MKYARIERYRVNCIQGIAVYCFCLSLLPGCAFYRPDYPEFKDPPKTVEDVDKHAEDIKTEYRKFTDRLGVTGFSLGVVLIPVAAATLGLGIAGAATNTITSMGLSSATLYGLGQWTVNTDKMRVYKAGETALQCLKTTSKPLHTAHDAYLKVDTDSIRKDLIKLGDLINTINDLIPNASANLRTTATEAVNQATETQKHANDALTLFEQGKTKANGLLLDYENAVTKVDGQTRTAATNADKSLADLKGQLATLKTSLSDWTPPVSSSNNATKSTNKSFVQTEQFKSVMRGFARPPDTDQKLNGQLDSLKTQLERINSDLDSIETASSELASLPVINYDPCISPLTAAAPAPVELQVSPMTLEVKQGQSSTLTIGGGVGPYSATIIGGTGMLPTFSSSTSKGGLTKIDVVTTSATSLGQYRAVVTDSSPSQQSKVIQITVKAP